MLDCVSVGESVGSAALLDVVELDSIFRWKGDIS